jgi:selenocysteine-specific elongation factor
MSATAPLTVGTAGHVDHGKTTLVRALTGKDTDRLAEEKRRGLSIELGYAPLLLPSGRQLSLVDVPGHERFVRTMVAGATGIDAFLLCVAADDGFMPQTREHLAVLHALGVTAGVVAITKADRAAPDAVAGQAADELPGIEAVAVDAVAGVGIDRLLAAMERATAKLVQPPGRAGGVRLHIDRSFTLRGIGTVVTGTLWSGSLSQGQQLLVLPQGARVRLRSLQVHDRPVERAQAGQRVALALTGISWRDVTRGDVICSPDADLLPSYRLEAVIRLNERAARLERGVRLQVHHGTRESAARLVPLDVDHVTPTQETVCQLRMERPLIACHGDALVLRQIAPPDTVGGGRVLGPTPSRDGSSEEPAVHVPGAERRAEAAGVRDRGASRPAGVTAPPAPPGPGALRLAALLEESGDRPPADRELEIAAELDGAAAREAWRELEQSGLAVRTAPHLHFHPQVLERLASAAIEICHRDGEATIARVRDELGTSRRYAQAILEHLDAAKVTIRHGDSHVLRRRHTGRPSA